MEEDGFVLVKRKNKNLKNRSTFGSKFMSSLSLSNAIVTQEEFNQARQRINTYKQDITVHPVWEAICHHITSISGSNPISEIVCYGLGSVLGGVSTYASRQQLALLLAIKDHTAVNVYAYDPAFGSQDLELLQSFNILPLAQNDYGKRFAETKTLFFMPRCPFELFNNLLWKNWANWNNVLFFGNDFTNLDSQLTSAVFEERYRFIYSSLSVLNTLRVNFADSSLDNVMNNCVFHSFSSCKVGEVSETDLAAAEPYYGD